MMNLKLIIGGLVVAAITAFATSSAEIYGWRAEGILSALSQGAGSYIDCGAGTCGTTVTYITCLKEGSAKARCILNVANSRGGLTPARLIEGAGEQLFTALKDVGLAKCDKVRCTVVASKIQCLFPVNSQEGDGRTRCSVD